MIYCQKCQQPFDETSVLYQRREGSSECRACRAMVFLDKRREQTTHSSHYPRGSALTAEQERDLKCSLWFFGVFVVYVLVATIVFQFVGNTPSFWVWTFSTGTALTGLAMIVGGRTSWDIATSPTITSSVEFSVRGWVARAIGVTWLSPLMACALFSAQGEGWSDMTGPGYILLGCASTTAIGSNILGCVLFGRAKFPRS